MSRTARVDVAHAMAWGLLTAGAVAAGIYFGSRQLRDFDVALVPYAGASVLSAFGLGYWYSMWLTKPPTRLYWWRGWRLFFAPSRVVQNVARLASLYGHAIGILCGYGALWLFGLQHAPPAMATGVSMARIGAAALSLASTGALMILLNAAHPPAGATTLIISLGIVTRPFHLLVIEIAVAILTLQAIAINRLAGIDYPLWALRDDAPRP